MIADSPVSEKLKLDVRKLPELVFTSFSIKGYRVMEHTQRSERAWESFGKPGRDPHRLEGVLALFADQRHWNQQLLVAHLRASWQQVVGASIAEHCEVSNVQGRILIVRAASSVWSTQLSFLLPQLKEKILRELPGIPIDDIKVIGPTTYNMSAHLH